MYDQTLMGESYIKMQHGPASKNLEAVTQELVRKGLVRCEGRSYHGKEQEKYVSLEDPDTSCLSELELAHVDSVLEELSAMFASKILAYSHGDVPWEAAKSGGELNYGTVFYRDDEYSKRAPEHAF